MKTLLLEVSDDTKEFLVLKLLCKHSLRSRTQGDLNISEKLLENSKAAHTHLFKGLSEAVKIIALFSSIPISLHHNPAFSVYKQCALIKEWINLHHFWRESFNSLILWCFHQFLSWKQGNFFSQFHSMALTPSYIKNPENIQIT